MSTVAGEKELETDFLRLCTATLRLLDCELDYDSECQLKKLTKFYVKTFNEQNGFDVTNTKHMAVLKPLQDAIKCAYTGDKPKFTSACEELLRVCRQSGFSIAPVVEILQCEEDMINVSESSTSAILFDSISAQKAEKQLLKVRTNLMNSSAVESQSIEMFNFPDSAKSDSPSQRPPRIPKRLRPELGDRGPIKRLKTTDHDSRESEVGIRKKGPRRGNDHGGLWRNSRAKPTTRPSHHLIQNPNVELEAVRVNADLTDDNLSAEQDPTSEESAAQMLVEHLDHSNTEPPENSASQKVAETDSHQNVGKPEGEEISSLHRSLEHRINKSDASQARHEEVVAQARREKTQWEEKKAKLEEEKISIVQDRIQLRISQDKHEEDTAQLAEKEAQLEKDRAQYAQEELQLRISQAQHEEDTVQSEKDRAEHAQEELQLQISQAQHEEDTAQLEKDKATYAQAQVQLQISQAQHEENMALIKREKEQWQATKAEYDQLNMIERQSLNDLRAVLNQQKIENDHSIAYYEERARSLEASMRKREEEHDANLSMLNSQLADFEGRLKTHSMAKISNLEPQKTDIEIPLQSLREDTQSIQQQKTKDLSIYEGRNKKLQEELDLVTSLNETNKQLFETERRQYDSEIGELRQQLQDSTNQLIQSEDYTKGLHGAMIRLQTQIDESKSYRKLYDARKATIQELTHELSTANENWKACHAEIEHYQDQAQKLQTSPEDIESSRIRTQPQPQPFQAETTSNSQEMIGTLNQVLHQDENYSDANDHDGERDSKQVSSSSVTPNLQIGVFYKTQTQGSGHNPTQQAPILSIEDREKAIIRMLEHLDTRAYIISAQSATPVSDIIRANDSDELCRIIRRFTEAAWRSLGVRKLKSDPSGASSLLQNIMKWNDLTKKRFRRKSTISSAHLLLLENKRKVWQAKLQKVEDALARGDLVELGTGNNIEVIHCSPKVSSPRVRHQSTLLSPQNDSQRGVRS